MREGKGAGTVGVSGAGVLVRGTGRPVAYGPGDFAIGPLFTLLREAAVVGEADTGRIVLWNPAAVNLFGYTAADAVGRPLEILVPERLRAAYKAGVHAFARTGHGALIDGGAPVELPALRKDGTEIMVEITLTPIGGPVKGRFVLALVRDASPRRRVAEGLRMREASKAAATLHISEDGRQLALRAAHMGTWAWDLSTGTGVASPEFFELLGLPAQAHIRKRGILLGRVHPDDRARLKSAEAAAFATGRGYEGEFRIVREGAIRWLAATTVVQKDADGRPVAMTGVIVDITERKEAEQQQANLQRTEKLRALGQMASGVAHDLNQSLALVCAYAELGREALARQPADARSLDEALTVISRAASDGGAVVARLLTFGRGQALGPLERLDVAALLHEVAQFTAPRWRDSAASESGRIVLEVAAPPDLFVEGDASGLRVALTNLVFNAIDALTAGGDIRLTARLQDHAVLIEVTDTGPGIPADVRAHMFEPYFTTKGERGTGLGLAQVWGIVQQNRGTIQVESVPGQGTTFQLTLPVAPAEAVVASTRSASAAESVPPRQAAGGPYSKGGFTSDFRPSDSHDQRHEHPKAAPTRRLRVLAVDDEPSLARMIATVLRRKGHTVRICLTAEDALQRMQKHAFDLVISDLGLRGGMNGWAFAAQVRTHWPGVKFVLSTGWGRGLDADEAAAKGVAEILAKPYRLADLERLADET